MKKARFWVLLAVVSALLIVIAAFLSGGHEVPHSAFRTATVKKGDIQSVVSSTGKLAPLNIVEVGSQVSGNIQEIYVDYNSVVKKDQVIALIDPAIYGGQVNQAKAQLLKARMELLEKQKAVAAAAAGVASAEAQRFAARSTLRDAERNYSRQTRLASRHTVSDAELDSALARRDNARGAVEKAEAQVRTSKAQLERARAQERYAAALIAEREAGLSLAETKLDYCTIQSPIDGVVISRNVDVGQTVAATLQSPVLFTIAEDLARMQVEIDVSEADVGQIRPSQKVEFVVDAFPDKTFQARVRQVRNSATSIQNVVTYKIVADVTNESLMLRPGMTANVTIVLATVGNALKIPNSALRFKPPGKIENRKTGKRPPVRERPLFKKTVKALDLDGQQSRELVRIIEKAEQKLRAAYALPEESRDIEQAWRGFFTQVLTQLRSLLREEQHEKFNVYVQRLREAREKRKRRGGRPASVYVPGDEGPVAVAIRVGITDDRETQVIGGELKEGEQVIVGLALSAEEGASGRSDNLFSRIFKRR